MNHPDQNDVSTALGLLRDSPAEEEQRIRSEGAKAMQEGEVTPHTAYYRPILEALVEMGGSGKTRAVLDRVGANYGAMEHQRP